MSRTDLFAKYTQLYQKTRAREIVPEGPFVRQLADVNTLGLDVGLFFKAKRKKPVQVCIGNPLPFEVAEQEGFLESDTDSYFSRTLISDFRTVQYVRVVVAAGMVLEAYGERMEFLKKCQRIFDVLLRKTRNVVHMGDFSPFRFDQRVQTLEDFLGKTLKMDEVGIEAAMIPFNVANPKYITLTGNDIVVFGDNPVVPHDVFQFVGGIGYTFDKKVGAVNEEQLFRTNEDLSQFGMDKAFIETRISQVTQDFQTNLHSLIFSDIWKKSTAKPVGVNFGGDILVKAESSSEIWMGVFEVYLKPPKA
ncbi:MAG: hypothetical protein EAX95_13175 [Candidatus Thorarchaeota archaeon]|nr:hypothetical protein [Candidatus Thorarchaeota archaeon]